MKSGKCSDQLKELSQHLLIGVKKETRNFKQDSQNVKLGLPEYFTMTICLRLTL
jgi:hypothetical protein